MGNINSFTWWLINGKFCHHLFRFHYSKMTMASFGLQKEVFFSMQTSENNIDTKTKILNVKSPTGSTLK